MFKVSVYLDDGKESTYELESKDKVSENLSNIMEKGYIHHDVECVELYPAHRISKVRTVSKEYAGG